MKRSVGKLPCMPVCKRLVESYPTGPFMILEPQNQEICKFDVVPKRDTMDFEASKLRKGRSGVSLFFPGADMHGSKSSSGFLTMQENNKTYTSSLTGAKGFANCPFSIHQPNHRCALSRKPQKYPAEMRWCWSRKVYFLPFKELCWEKNYVVLFLSL